MRRPPGSLSALSALVWALLIAPPLGAQSVTTAVVTGTVTGPAGQPLPGSLVTLTSLDRGGSRELDADRTGFFRFGLVAPGSYELRAETLGYRPVVARILRLTGGERATLDLVLAQAAPPVLTVDTVAVGAAAASRFEAGGVRLAGPEIDGLPHRFEDLTSVTALAPALDGELGVQGLPGSMTLTVADGVPVYRAPHPVARAEQVAQATFPRTALSGVTVLHNAPDVEWAGSAGGHAGLTTLTGTPERALVVEGSWSGGPLWSSSELDFSTPSLLSFEGAARATIPVTPGASQIVLSGEAFRQDTPLTPRVSEPVASGLSGLDPNLVEKLTEPSVERYSRYSGLLRFDSQSDQSHFFFRGAAGYAERDFDGPGALTLARDAAPPEESIEYSLAGGYIRELQSELTFELRGGVSGGTRTFEPTEEGMPAAMLVESASSLGFLQAGPGESSRTDFVLSPLLRYRLGGGTLKTGVAFRFTTQSLLSSRPTGYLFSDGAALVAGQGYVGSVSAPEASFTTQELGGFAQYEAELAPGLRATLGARFDYERIPAEEATLNGAWLQASGIRNDDYPNGFSQLGGVASLTWEPSSRTRLYGTLSVHHGDLDARALGELFARDVDATEIRFAGSGVSWPSASVPGASTSLPTLTLFGPDTRPPRSMQASFGVVRHLFEGWSVHLGGAFRRTDFLLRRRNLNLPLMPQAADPNGRGVYGTLQQDGALVTATGADALRFDPFYSVAALDPDGWSEYLGATAGLEYASESADLLLAYTRSETTDNWVGASSGRADAELGPLLPDEDWADGTSDFDVPHRITAAGTARVSLATVSAVYRFRSGLPFTPRYRDGVDANGDGSVRNDVAYVDAVVVDPLLSDWSCLDDQIGGFAVRNSCRGPSAHSLDVRLSLRLTRIAGRDASLVIDGFNLIESEDGIVDDALLLVDPAGSITTSPDGGTVTIPTVLNPDFGRILYPATRGRMLRVGFRIG